MANGKGAATPASSNPFDGSQFGLSLVDAPPPAPRVGRGGGGDNKTMSELRIMAAAPAPAEGKAYNFFVPAADVPESITDTAERDKGAKENARRLSNSLSGYVRRLRGTADKPGDFPNVVLETRTETRDGKIGMAVYRYADKAPTAPAAPSASA